MASKIQVKASVQPGREVPRTMTFRLEFTEESLFLAGWEPMASYFADVLRAALKKEYDRLKEEAA